MTKQVTAYLAHAFENRQLGREWQLKMHGKYPWLKIINPFYDGPEQVHVQATDNGQIKDPYALKFDGKEYMHYQQMVDFDLMSIGIADIFIILVNDSIQWGSPIELGNAFTRGKTIFICVQDSAPAKLQNHPWSLALDTNHNPTHSLDELEEVLVKTYGQS